MFTSSHASRSSSPTFSPPCSNEMDKIRKNSVVRVFAIDETNLDKCLADSAHGSVVLLPVEGIGRRGEEMGRS